MKCANLMANLKAILALPKWAKIFLSVISIIALFGIVGAFVLNKSIQNETFSANLILKSQDSRESNGVFAYNLHLDFPKFKPLLRSKSISNVDISRYLWDKSINQSAIQNLHGNNRNLWFESTQDLRTLGLENIGSVEYKISFNPLIYNILKNFIVVLVIAILINATYQIAPLKGDCVSFGRIDYVFALILAIITAFLCAGQVDSGHNWGGDFSGYIAQGIALAQGTTAQYISENTLMMDKCDWLFGPYAYPWGFPLLLAPIYKIFGFNIIAFKAVNILCYAIFVGIFYIFCAKRLPRNYALIATLFFAINPNITAFVANNILSDVSFLLFGFVALIILAKLFCESVDCHESLCNSRNDDNIATKSHGILIAIFGGVFMLFASLIRMNGFVILCALIAMHGILLAKRFAPQIFKIRALQFLKRVDSPYPPQIHAIPYIIFALGFAIVALNLSSGGSGHWSALARLNGAIILDNMDYYAKVFEDFFTGTMRLTLFFLCLPLIYLGIREGINSAKGHESIFYLIFVCGFMLLLLLWIGTQGIRFVYLVLPFAVFWGAKGLIWLNAKGDLFGRFMSAILLISLASFASVANQVKFTREVPISGAYTKNANEIWDFIKQNTPQDSVILFHKPRVLYLNTGRIAFASNNIARFAEADFVLWEIYLWGDGAPYPNSREFIERTNLIFQNPQFRLYKVKK